MRRLPLACLALLPLFGTTTSADVIGLDARNGFSPAARLADGSDFIDFRDQLTSLGHELVSVASFTSTDLEGIDVLMVIQAYDASQNFTGLEIAAIQDFVTNGGGFLLHADGGGFSDGEIANLNALAAAFGVNYQGSRVDPSGRELRDLVAHPVTAGVSSFGVDFHRPMALIVAPALDLTNGGGNDNVIAAVEGFNGGGNAVLLSDSNSWSNANSGGDFNIASLDNALLLENIVDFLLPEVDPIALADPVPGIAGQTNDFTVSDARTGDRVLYLFGLSAGDTPIPGCEVDLGLVPLGLLGSVIADQSGGATVSINVPPVAAGLTVLFQAVQPGQCNPSPVVSFTFL